MPKTRVVLADDHVILTQGLREILGNRVDVVACVRDGQSLLRAARDLRPDVIVTDISMPLLNGLDAIRNLKAEKIGAKVIVLTMHREASLAEEAFRAGVSGYVLKESASEELVDAIRTVADGHCYLTPLIAKDLLTILLNSPGEKEPGSLLTPRQREVLHLIAEGKTMKEVASVLNISPRTAESHKYEMMHAIGVQTTAELIQYGLRSGILADRSRSATAAD